MIANEHRIRKLPVLVLHANNRCNCRCVMCSIWKSTDDGELTPQRLRGLLPDIRTLGVEDVVFTGGEPLMNSALPELCAIVRELGIRVTLLTTGLLLGRYAATLADVVDEVIVSLDGPPEIHDRIRRVVGAFDLLSRGVEALHAAAPQIPVSGRCTIQKLNCAALTHTVDSARRIGLRSISFLAADLTTPAFNRTSPLSIIEQSALGLTVAEIDSLDQEIHNLKDFETGFILESPEKLQRMVCHFRAQLGLADPVAPRCNAPWISAVLDTDGSLRPCFFHPPVGNLAGEGLERALNSAEATTFRSQLQIADNPICRRCVCSLYRPS